LSSTLIRRQFLSKRFITGTERTRQSEGKYMVGKTYPILINDVDNGTQFATVSAIVNISHTPKLDKSVENLK
jgi:hypothetical protein